MKTKISLLIILVLTILSCEKKLDQSLEYTLPHGVWNKFDPIAWENVLIEGDQVRNLVLEIETNEKFQSEIISFQLITESSDGENRNQGFDIEIKDFNEENKEGKKRLSMKLKQAGHFAGGKSYNIEFVSLMPHLTTRGVEKIALKFVK